MGILDVALNGFGPETSDHKYSEALAHLLKYDLARSCYFQVDIFDMNKKFADAPKRSGKFLCHSAELPGESSATINQKIYSINEQHHISTSVNPITLSFYSQGSGIDEIRTSFLSWMGNISGRYGSLKVTQEGVTGESTYNVAYKDDYSGIIQITQFAITGEPLVKVELYDAFPISINQVPLDWAAQNAPTSLQVTFSYVDYQYTMYNVNGEGVYHTGILGEMIGLGMKGYAIYNSVRGAIESNNPAAIASNLPHIGLSDFTLSSLFGKKGI